MKVNVTVRDRKTNIVLREYVNDYGKDVTIFSRIHDIRMGGDIKWLTTPEFLECLAIDHGAKILAQDNTLLVVENECVNIRYDFVS